MIGQQDTLRLHLAEGADVEALAAALRTLPDVLQVSTRDRELILLVPEAETAISPVIVKADQLQVKIRSVDMQEPNLEAVFLHLTGRALRD